MTIVGRHNKAVQGYKLDSKETTVLGSDNKMGLKKLGFLLSGGETVAKVSITSKVALEVVFMPFHFPGTNILTVDALDKRAKIPEFKVAACKIAKE